MADRRGLLFEPTFEHEVVILFSLCLLHLKDSFVIEEYPVRIIEENLGHPCLYL